MRQALRAAAASPVHYERRRPEETTLYRLVQDHLGTFLAEVEAGGVASLPQFVKNEFDAFLECGILAHGFLRVRCAECGHEKLVAFSCKRRGICPSCGARRMAETAAWLVDRVIPKVPVRQWVLSFPIPEHTPAWPGARWCLLHQRGRCARIPPSARANGRGVASAARQDHHAHLATVDPPGSLSDLRVGQAAKSKTAPWLVNYA